MQFDQYPREELRNKLTGLGIAREKHHVRLLQEMLPLQLDKLPFNGSDPDTVAEVLIFLMGKNIIRAPFEVDAVLDFAWGVHAGQFHEDIAEMLEFVLAYFRKGLENREQCIWVIADPLASPAVAEFRRQALQCIEAQQLQVDVVAHNAIFTDAQGKLKPWVALLEYWAMREQSALENGYQGLRIATDSQWVNREDWDHFLQYQYLATRALAQRRVKAVSTYSLATPWLEDIMDVAETHRAVFARRGKEWHRIATSDRKEVETLLVKPRSMQKQGN
jgi:hypothetical protein